ncbi:PlexA [Cordylochernes scorpioides]|uniref:PlexA n=1 Tax=Cordylochernes scorpioides TaxID=51811 RepID=A0ABY6LQY0_9ARAC|nr:PlexA [Cordylochernes scorpioides]
MRGRRGRRWWLSAVVLACCWWLQAAVAERFFEDTSHNRTRFDHMTLFEYTGKVYVGGLNRLYQLSADLSTLEAVVEMGPQLDSPKCPVSRVCPLENKVMTDYHNKALVVDFTESRLIACGSLFQGICTVHQINNISRYETPANESVVANNATASTVAFIAAGPERLTRRHVLYVGVTFTANGLYRSDVPAVSSRSLDPSSMFSLAYQDVTTGTKVYVNSMSRETYPITYVYGFSSRSFAYFLTVQKNASMNRFISKLVRVCQNDPFYYSYTEVPLVCQDPNGTDYNVAQAAFVGSPGSELAVSLGITAQEDVLFAVFARSQDEGGRASSQPGPSSALCVYALNAIHRKFTLNIQECFNGHGPRGLDFINPSQKCTATQLKITDDFCGMDVNTPLGGNLAIEAVPVLQYPNTRLTAVAATSTHAYTVVFLGTATGHLKKAVVESAMKAREYHDRVVQEGSPVSKDLLMNRGKDKLYIMTRRRVTMIDVQECDVYKTCSQCLGAHDPYCGWCSLENTCSLRGSCAQAAQDPLYWLSYKNGRCTTIVEVLPDKIQRTTARILNLAVDNLPALEGQFLCAFSAYNKTLITNATRTAAGITCATPHTDDLPLIPPGRHHITVKLSVRMKIGPDFVATNFTFFDCSTFTSCTQCVSSPFPCDWCVGGLRCTHDTGENCRNDILVTGLASVGPSIRSGPGFCPRINTTNLMSPEILVPSGLSKRIQVKVENTQPFIVSTRFVCQFNIEGRVRQTQAQLLGEIIYCDPMAFSYGAPVPNITATFAVIWDGSKPLDNPENIHVVVYRCQEMAQNCGECLEHPAKYACGWCQNSCQVVEQCDPTSGWLDRLQTCPDPAIGNFTPVYGPTEGGTNITIEGINLGRKPQDVEVAIVSESAPNDVVLAHCDPIPNAYVKTSRIICQLRCPACNHTGGVCSPGSGKVQVRVNNEYMALSTISYNFVNPIILSIHPIRGPISGGTRLVIKGKYMDAGSKARAYLGNLPCHIIERDSYNIHCLTPPLPLYANQTRVVRVEFDCGKRAFNDHDFIYMKDPEVESVGYEGNPKGIPSGGIAVPVHGKNLNIIQKPVIYIIYEGREYNGSCASNISTKMICLWPEVPPLKNLVKDQPLSLHYGFRMDNVKTVHNITRNPNFRPLLMHPDPVYYPFTEKDHVKYYKSDYLTINGMNLDRASRETDVTVRIGTSICNVTSLSHSQLTCRPPTTQPENQNDPYDIPSVVVKVGHNLEFTIGQLSYEIPAMGEHALSRPIVIGMVVGGCVLLFIVVAILIAYRRKSTESSRVLRNMQEQMDVLELRVASECKEAFAELQTEMTDLTSDLTGTAGIPFLDYRTYAMKVLFPNNEDHPVLRDMPLDPLKKPHIERGLRQFGQLVMNKTFLLLFIRTLEANRYFSMRDRVNVASLIMVTLQGKMEYCTDILKTLLAELIEKCIEGKSHPKLLLRRQIGFSFFSCKKMIYLNIFNILKSTEVSVGCVHRTESVAEKMLSSWFTFLLFKFLKECAGEPLFLLYRAIKQQVDKGPVDAVTSEARYSLSEEKLIRQSIEYRCLTVYVSISSQTAYVTGLEPPGENVETSVKVLDCDTISQVKEKALDTIYRHAPCSQRPPRDSLDLEWRTGATGRLTLADYDATSKVEGEWRRLNTLAHYKVPEGALLTLVPRPQAPLYNLPTEKHKYETLHFGSSPPLSPSPLESGCKTWHLVKHHDAENNKEGGDRSNKMVSEIYLTRLLATKGTLQKFVDDLFETIFSTAHRGSALPLAIKYMFDFLDDQALHHGIADPEVVHTWKSNSLPLRFWVNLIKNPNFVFDIHKTNIVDSCLSVVAQTFMDACSTSDHRLGKDSPSSKLLYAKDIPLYKEWVDRYYGDIKLMTSISDQDMNAMLAEESRLHAHEFNTNVALYDLYSYAHKYNEQVQTCIKFCVKNKIKCVDAFRMLTVAYREATLDRSNVYRRYKMFSEGREDVNDEERAGRPSTSTTDEKINEVEKMILANRQITVREVAEDLNISIGSCHSIFINDLGMRRVAAKFLPKLLNCDQKQHRMNIANEMLDSVRDDPNLLQRVITGDEAWVYGYDVETKAQSSQWKLPHEPRPKKALQVRSNVKVLLTVFFDCRGVVHHEFLPQGRTVNKEYYLQVMRNLREVICQKRPDLWKNKNWLLHHDNAPAHTSLLVHDFLAKNNTLMMPQPPYSPDLAPVTFSCSLN